MMQGIQSLMPQGPQEGPQQGPMPGQAPQGPMPGMMPQQGAPTPQAMVGPLTQMHLQQLTQLMLNPRPDGPPLYAVLTAINEKQKQAQAQASMQRQMAMAQGQQAAQQPPVAQQVLAQAQQMQEQQGIAQPRMGVEDYKRQAAALSDQGRHAEAMQLLELAKEQEHREFTRQGREYADGGIVALRNGGALRFAYGGDLGYRGKSGIADIDIGEPELPKANELELLRAEILAQANQRAELAKRYGAINPEIVAARKEAADLAQKSLAEREARATGMLERANMPLSQSLLDNQEALLRMAGAARGKTVGDVLSSIAGSAGQVRGEQRKAVEFSQQQYQAEKNAMDALRQAQAERKVAELTGDDNLKRAAIDKEEAAKEALLRTRLQVEKERVDQEEKKRDQARQEQQLAQQAQLAREQMANAVKVAQIGASAKGSMTDIAERRLALQQLKMDPEYTAAMNKVKELSKAAGLSNSPTVQAAFRTAQQEALTVAKKYGLTPQDLTGAVSTDTGTAAPAGQRVVDFSTIK